VPIYNAAPYLEKCIESLMHQTLDDIEYIFINDASTDESACILSQVIKKYPHRYSKVENLDTNGGISNARNIGLSKATGEYVTHCDSDDWVDPEMYETLYHIASEHCADIAACNFINEYEHSSKTYSQPYSTNMEDNIRSLLDGSIFPSLWSSIIKRELIKNQGLQFPKNLNMGEDLLFNVRAYLRANKIVHTTIPLYHYRHSTNSICVRRSIISINSDITIAQIIEKELIENGVFQKYAHEIMFRKFFSKLPLINDMNDCDSYKTWLTIYPETNKKIWQYSKIDWKQKLRLWLAANGMLSLAKLFQYLLIKQHKYRQFFRLEKLS